MISFIDNVIRHSILKLSCGPVGHQILQSSVILYSHHTSPSACLLRQASLSPEPEDGDKDVDVDLYQAAVLILAHLDRLASPFIQTFKSVYFISI
jgi:hypothetical protein